MSPELALKQKVKTNTIAQVRKRNGDLVDFNEQKIADAAYKAMVQTGEGTSDDSLKIARSVKSELLAIRIEKGNDYIPEVEEIQDLVEKHLIYMGFAHTAKAYILFRKARAELREKGIAVPEDVRKLVEESSKYFRNPLAELVYYVSYSKWQPEVGRRETWIETVNRFMKYMESELGNKLKTDEYKEVKEAILKQEAIPSMRLMWSSGPASKATNVAAYNCSFTTPTKLRDFGEIMYISMCGAGLGFSVESSVVQQLPLIKRQTGKKVKTYVVGDSKEGWADAFVHGLETWFDGNDVDFDYSQVRPRGARLKTMGGRASGPDPLMDLMQFARSKILKKQGKRLSNLDVHDIICKIGEIVVSGGVRRSAMISLSDLDDEEMRHAKDGQFYLYEGQRSLANNSTSYNEKPSASEFLDEWISLMKSGSGERGIWNRASLKYQLPERRWKTFQNYLDTSGVNPCGEIVLRSKQFCNLTGIVVRAEDTEASLMRKVRIASILGTYQATLNNFPYLSPEWKKNCKEEALLGVSFTGYFDNKVIRKDNVLRKLRDEAISVNKKYAKRFGINQATAVTCVKPSGNSSQLLDTASGMHPRYAHHYIRRVRVSANDPVFQMMKDQGVPFQPEVGQTEQTATTYVLEFPVKAPKDSVVKDDVSALDLLEEWKKIKLNFTEHNPSATIYVGPDEWIEVGNWVYKNWDLISGLSFLPRNDHVYRLAPYEEITEEKYNELLKTVEHIDFSKLFLYERADNTKGAKEFACVSGACEI